MLELRPSASRCKIYAPHPEPPAAVADRVRRRQSSLSLQPFGERDGQDRRHRRTSSTTSPSARSNTRAWPVQQTSTPRLPLRRPRGAAVRDRRPDHAAQSSRSGNFPGAGAGRVVGQTGLEASTTSTCRAATATAGRDQRPGDPDGIRQDQAADRGREPEAVARHAGSSASARPRSRSRSTQNGGGAGGAFVAMNPDNGQIYAMGSQPDVQPERLHRPDHADGLRPDVRRELRRPAAQPGDPERRSDRLRRSSRSRRRRRSRAAPGSSTRSRRHRQVLLPRRHRLPAQLRRRRLRRGRPGPGDPGLRRHLLLQPRRADERDPDPVPNGGPLQQWARKFGIGRNDRDRPARRARAARSRTRAGAATRNKLEAECDTRRASTSTRTGQPARRSAGYHRSPSTPRAAAGSPTAPPPWTEGDNVNMAVGQGDVQVTPLQLAVAYSALANGGTIVTPHVGDGHRERRRHRAAEDRPRPPKRHLHINPAYLRRRSAQGLREAASQPGRHLRRRDGQLPRAGLRQDRHRPVHPQRQVESDYAWYACFVPATATSKPIVVVVWVEKGGFGDVAAAPVARQILSQWFFGKPGPVHGTGRSATL